MPGITIFKSRFFYKQKITQPYQKSIKNTHEPAKNSRVHDHAMNEYLITTSTKYTREYIKALNTLTPYNSTMLKTQIFEDLAFLVKNTRH